MLCRHSKVHRNRLSPGGIIGYQDADGYFYILDRLKDMIVTGGENVYCGEVESVVLAHPAVREVAVFGIQYPMGRACGRLRRPENGHEPNNGRIGPLLPPKPGKLQGSTPHQFSDTDLPKSGSGKVLKRLLRERF